MQTDTSEHSINGGLPSASVTSARGLTSGPVQSTGVMPNEIQTRGGMKSVVNGPPGLAPGDFFVPGIQAPRFGVGKATLARWAKLGLINRYGTSRKCLYLASEITNFIMNGKSLNGETFKKPSSPLHKLHHPEMYDAEGQLLDTAAADSDIPEEEEQ